MLAPLVRASPGYLRAVTAERRAKLHADRQQASNTEPKTGT